MWILKCLGALVMRDNLEGLLEDVTCSYYVPSRIAIYLHTPDEADDVPEISIFDPRLRIEALV